MDEFLNGYANSAAAHAGALHELRLLSQTRHTRSAYLAALKLVEEAWQVCEQVRVAFRQQQQAQ